MLAGLQLYAARHHADWQAVKNEVRRRDRVAPEQLWVHCVDAAVVVGFRQLCERNTEVLVRIVIGRVTRVLRPDGHHLQGPHKLVGGAIDEIGAIVISIVIHVTGQCFPGAGVG